MKKNSFKILLVLQLIFFIQTRVNAQTLTTDKPDYPPGDTAIITGAGFQPGETVTLRVTHAAQDSIPDTGEDHFQWYIIADSLGGFVTKWHVCEDDCLGANLVASADGNSSGYHAEVYFTDALKTDTYPISFSAFASSATYCQGAAPSNLNAAWSNTTCNGINNGGNTNIPIIITWYKNSINSTSGGTAVQTTTSNAGTTSSIYTPSTNIAGTFYYYVVISWSAGTNCAPARSMTTSATKTLVVNPTPATPTVSTNGPVVFCQGGSVVLSSSSGSSNNWYNSSGIISGETGQNFTVTTAGSYSVIVTAGSCSSAPSAPVNVTVNPYPTGGISILAPNPSTICSGSSTTIKFNGTANASLSYNKNGVLQSSLTLNNGGISNQSTGPLTSNTSYEVVSVTSNGCTTTSGFSPASLTITVNQPPAITGQPVSQTVTYGSPANFIVSATGDGLTYQWQQDAGSGFSNISNLANVYSGVTTATLNIERPTVAMSGYKYRVVVSGICSPTAISNEAILTVNKAPLMVTAEDKSKVYGEADPALTYTASGILYYDDSYNVITGVSLSTASGSAATTGTHAIVASGGVAANYDIAYVNGILSVSLRPVTVTADALSKVYGNVDTTLTFQVTSGSLAYNDSITGSLTRMPGESVSGSPYAIQKGTIANNNYTITYVGADFSITPLSVNVTADAKTKVYGALDPALTYTSSPAIGYTLPNGELIGFTGSLSRVTGENVGAYAINQGSLTNTNYNISYSSANLSITPLSVSVTADGKTKVYGSIDPILTFISNPAVNSALPNGELIGFTGSLSRVVGENVGAYAINQGSLTNTNYNISYSSANLSITPLSVSVTADSKTKVYGSVDPTLTFISNPAVNSALANGELIGFTGSLSRVAGENVGTYAINQGSLTNTNYNISYSSANLSITPLSVSVTADGKTKVYGSIDPTLTFISNPAVNSALANGELIGFTGSLSRVAGENVGTYAINQGSLTNTNYNISYSSANLSITPLSVSVTADGKTKVYGSVDPTLTFISNPAVNSALANGELVGFTGSLSRVVGENVGTYAINQGSLTNTNYNISYSSANLSITPLSVSITADGKTKVYGSVDPTLTFISNPAVNSALANGELIGFTGSLSRVVGENVGTYAINQGSLTNTNYNISYSSANLSITPLSVSVTANPKTKVYGSADPALTYMSNPTLGSALGNGELVNFTGSLERDPGEDVGNYIIRRGSVDNTNYNITYTSANLVITKAVVTSSVVVSPNVQQYSDRVTYCAIIRGGAPLISGGPQAGTSVTFKVGTQIIATNVPLVVSGLDIKATYTASLLEPSPYGTAPTGQMAPGNAVVTASINGVNSNYSLSPVQPTTAITILKENDPVYYTGGEFASTGSSTSNVANIRLAASVTDENDGYPGDIRNARVRFKIQPYNCDISMTPQSIVYTSWRPVSLVNTASTTIGTAYLDTTFNIGSCDAKIYDITVEVGGYYTGNSDVVTVTVAKSMNDFISGGGHNDFGSGSANKSSGVYKSTDNSKANWGFNVKYNKNKTNLQGNANIIIRSGGKVYQVKGIVGGSNGSLNTNVSDPHNKKATLTAKANMVDLATGLPVNYGSNATLELKMSDKGEPGANIDTYGFTIWGSNGSLLYSNNWSVITNSTNEAIINGGNIQVGSGLSGRFVSPDDSVADSVNTIQGEPYSVKIFPNPTDKDRISISIFGTEEQTKSAQLYIFDVTGKLIHSDENFCLQHCNETVLHLDQKYIAGIYLVDVVVNGKVYHQKLIVQ